MIVLPGVVMRFRLLVSLLCVSFLLCLSRHASAEGAFAFGQYGNGGWTAGVSHDLPTKDAARAEAMQDCINKGTNCRIRHTFTKTCFAYAVQNGSRNGWAYGTHPELDRAESAALSQCQTMGVSCTVHGSYCDNTIEGSLYSSAVDQANQGYDEFAENFRACFAEAKLSELGDALAKCDQALAFGRVSNIDRGKLTLRRQILATEQDRYSKYSASYDSCMRGYVESDCNDAMASNYSSGPDLPDLLSRFALANMFSQNMAACKSGSARACDRALQLAIPQRDRFRSLLLKAREETSSVSRAWAYVAGPVEQAASFVEARYRDMFAKPEGEQSSPDRVWPTSTIVFAAISFLLAMALFIVISRSRGTAPAPGVVSKSPAAAPVTQPRQEAVRQRPVEVVEVPVARAPPAAKEQEKPAEQVQPAQPASAPPVQEAAAKSSDETAAAPNKGLAIAALVCALLAIIVPIYGFYVSALSLVLAVFAALSGERVFVKVVPIIAFVNSYFLSPSLWLAYYSMAPGDRFGLILLFAAFMAAPIVAMLIKSYRLFDLRS